MQTENKLQSVWFPLLFFLGFFIVQVAIKPSEVFLTILAVVLTIIIALLQMYQHEVYVFILGLLLGLFVEVFLGLFARQQQWTDASLLGAPLWLPIIWGIGFVVITRVGINIEGLKRK